MALSTMEQSDFSVSFAFIECAPTDLVGMRDGEAFENASVFKLFPERRLRELSPIHYASADLPPILIFHGDQDRTVDISQSQRYVQAVEAAGGEAELVRYPGGDHVFLNFSDEMWYEQESRALAFFAREFRDRRRAAPRE
jgi:dipeptidyl aminopeptidase/acylaminoacyl peptidase